MIPKLKLIKNILFFFLFCVAWLNPFQIKPLFAATQTSFSAVTYTVAENAGTATITVYRNGGSTGPVTVDYATSNGTARAGTDYTAASGTLTFADGDTNESFTVPIIDNDAKEPTKTVKLTLSNPTGGVALGSQKTAVLYITNDDESNGQLEFSAAAYTVGEDEATGYATITVNRNNGSHGAVTVNYATANGTAKAGTDYTAATNTLTFADGDSAAKTFTVPIINDTAYESTETVKLTLKSPTGGATLGSMRTAVLNITNDDASPGQFEFSASTYTVAEDVSGGTVTVEVYRNGGSSGEATVNYATSDGTAKAGTDYTAATDILTFADGETIQTFEVTITNDEFYEPTETIKLTLSNPAGGATLGSPKTAVLRIASEDSSNGEMEFSLTSYNVMEDAGTVTVEVNRNGGDNGPVTVNYATSDGTAKAGTDYTAVNDTLTFADGDTAAKTFDVPILNDSTYEPTKTVKLTLSSPTGGATLGSQKTAVLNIINDDESNGRLEFSAAAYTVAEDAGTVTVSVYRTGGSNGLVTVNYGTTNGTAKAGVDYTAVNDTLTFADGDTAAKTFDVPITDDTVYEPTETVKLTLSSPTGGATLGSQKTAVLNITNDEASPGQLEFSDASYTFAENAGTVAITVNRSDSSGAVSVNYATSNGTAKTGVDYTAASGTLDFADGQTTNTFNVPIIDDGTYEPAETVKLTLRNPTGGATLGTQKTAVLNIADDDNKGLFEFSAATYTVAEDVVTAEITVSRNGGSSGDVSVVCYTGNGTAKAGTDYTATSTTLNFADTETTKAFYVTITDDGLCESTETVKLSLTSPAGGAILGALKSAVLYITDDDASNGQLTFSAATYTVAENTGTATVTVNREGGDSGAVTVDYAATNGTARAGADYTATSGTLIFADGDSAAKTFDVSITDDGLYEKTETIKLKLSSPTGGAILGPQKTAVLNITDDDCKGELALSDAAYTAAEDAGTAAITVERSGSTSGAVTVNYATTNGSAKAGADYTAASGSLSFADGEASKTFDVPIIDDSLYEPAETVKITLSRPTDGATLGARKTAVLSITDDDESNGQFEFSAASYTVAEDEATGYATITVNRIGGDHGAVTVRYATSNGTAKAGADYKAANGTLNFADGETSQTFEVDINNEDLNEPTETVKLTLSRPAGGAALGSQKTALLRITNDDSATGEIEF